MKLSDITILLFIFFLYVSTISFHELIHVYQFSLVDTEISQICFLSGNALIENITENTSSGYVVPNYNDIEHYDYVESLMPEMEYRAHIVSIMYVLIIIILFIKFVIPKMKFEFEEGKL